MITIFNEPTLAEADRMDADGNGVIWRKDLKPGASCWLRDHVRQLPAVLVFVCPCGCGATVHIPVKPFDPMGWTWDGNLERPTLSPSIQRTTGCRWHGWLRNGVLTTC